MNRISTSGRLRDKAGLVARCFCASLRYFFCALLCGLHLQAFAQPPVQKAQAQGLQITDMWVENRTEPMGIGVSAPRFSWALDGSGHHVLQTAYEIRVADDLNKLRRGRKLVWQSGKQMTAASRDIIYQGTPLSSVTAYYWQVRSWDNQGRQSDWSEPARFTTGALSIDTWKARWIEPGYAGDTVNGPSPLLRRDFTIGKKVKSAHALITARGIYEAYINGKKVGNGFLTPGWTNYKTRLQYQSYDVTDLLTEGDNVIGVMLGSGWYRSPLAWGEHNANRYGTKLGLLLQLELVFEDGSRARVVSDGTWRSSTGEVRYSEIYNGEIIDHRLSQPGWKQSGFDDHHWTPVKVTDDGYEQLLATENELVERQEVLQPVKVITTPRGEQVLDFGQNLVGWVGADLQGAPGDTIRLYHSEVLDKEGNFYTANLRAAKAEDQYILGSSLRESFRPHFTWHGFRYVKVEGVKGSIRPEDFTAVALYSAMPVTGQFSSSDTLLNKLQQNIEWGLRGNFLDIPTDCPQRDERLGWTGDAQVFFRTASFLRNANSFFSKWMKDVAADQLSDGRVPHVVPNLLGDDASASAGWADAATIIPWNMYLAYGNKQTLHTQYPSMKAWVDYLTATSREHLWNTGEHFGDWLFYRPDDDVYGWAAVTDKHLIAQCFYAHSTQLLINAATVLHKEADVSFYTKLLEDVKKAFLREYVTPSGRLVSGTQTAYVLALQFDMLPENLRQQAAKRLVDNIRSYDNHITTGFLGTPYINLVLTRFGYSDVAYDLLLQRSYPSWLYPVTKGATTIWERWNGIKTDGNFQGAGMNSFNHYAYGAIGEWMYRKMVGLDSYEDGPGYKHSKIQPYIGGSITHASASLKTYYGTLSNSWHLAADSVVMLSVIPVNTTATLYVPTTDPGSVRINGKPVASLALGPVSVVDAPGTPGKFLRIELGSGHYSFTSAYVLPDEEPQTEKK